MKEELKQLYLKLSAVETKGSSTIVMADALVTLSKIVEAIDENKTTTQED